VPTAGDFRIDINEQAKAELAQQYAEHFNQRLDGAMRDIWGRLHDCLTHMSDRLTDSQDGKRRIFHDTMLTNASNLVELLGRLNVTNDAKLEEARKQLHEAICTTDIDDLKEHEEVRTEVKSQVDSILAKFEW
jgi:cell division FtsZ-interacting protein ZapD